MSPAEILKNALEDGVNVEANKEGNIKITGDREQVAKWLPTIRDNKEAILTVLYGNQEQQTPVPCESCDRFEAIEILGAIIPGCLYEITDSEWTEGWKRLPRDLKRCVIH